MIWFLFLRCYHTSKSIFSKTQQNLEISAASNTVMRDLINAGVIKHFELAYETGWKFLKEYLANKYDCKETSPKSIFRECHKYQLFPESIVNDLIILAEARNSTTHIYNQILAQEVCNSITDHYKVFGQILKIIEVN